MQFANAQQPINGCLPLYLQSCPLFCGIPLTLIPSKLPVILRYVTYPYTFKVARYSAVCHLHN
ncbi:hypothetical protein [Photobacterium carnosum]|uniref:hypothetical protein n=1 Tax=Photobacterium carnosum TaxID=2023717 RepID=UPI001181A4A0|nr:hypothetical protein [Photobacterium carnosum]